MPGGPQSLHRISEIARQYGSEHTFEHNPSRETVIQPTKTLQSELLQQASRTVYVRGGPDAIGVRSGFVMQIGYS